MKPVAREAEAEAEVLELHEWRRIDSLKHIVTGAFLSMKHRLGNL